MKKKFALVAMAVLLMALIGGNSVAAAGPTLTVNPTSGPAGTVFTFRGSGFSPNKVLNVYANEPDGLASNGCYNYVVTPCNPKTDAAGNVTFVWRSDRNESYAQALGVYIWSLRELLGGDKYTDAQTMVTITGGGGESLAGATLSISPSKGRRFTFSGTGFAPNESVNTWLALPPGCSSDLFAFPSQAIESGAFKTDSAGKFTGTIEFTSFDAILSIPPFVVFVTQADCTGIYSLSARALGSKAGGTVAFEVTGDPVKPTGGTSLNVTVVNPINGGADPRNPMINALGLGYAPGEAINCWSTRPDGRTYAEPGVGFIFKSGVNSAFRADSRGSFTATWPVGWSWWNGPELSTEDPGMWTLTCRGVQSNALATDTFWIGPVPQGPSGGNAAGGGGSANTSLGAKDRACEPNCPSAPVSSSDPSIYPLDP